MAAYYNEIDPYAAQWLRNLIKEGHIAPGDVDERSIVDVRADDLRGYTQAHFFAGIGGWSIALRIAGWPDDRSVWTGSCPCQPFSVAGAGKAANDERHLWPAWFPLIAQCGPTIVFGEQVEAAVGWGWLDAVFADLEGEGYACGATVLPACGVGAPHIRQRLWFVADSNSGGEHRGLGEEKRASGPDERKMEGAVGQRVRTLDVRDSTDGTVANADGGDASAEREQRSGQQRQQPQDSGAGELGYAADERHERCRPARERRRGPADAGQLGNAECAGLEGHGRLGAIEIPQRRQGTQRHYTAAGFWDDAEWIACTDGKSRPVGPGSFPLGHGIQRRASKLRAYGNAIVPQVAAEFIRAARSN